MSNTGAVDFRSIILDNASTETSWETTQVLHDSVIVSTDFTLPVPYDASVTQINYKFASEVASFYFSITYRKQVDSPAIEFAPPSTVNCNISTEDRSFVPPNGGGIMYFTWANNAWFASNDLSYTISLEKSIQEKVVQDVVEEKPIVKDVTDDEEVTMLRKEVADLKATLKDIEYKQQAQIASVVKEYENYVTVKNSEVEELKARSIETTSMLAVKDNELKMSIDKTEVAQKELDALRVTYLEVLTKHEDDLKNLDTVFQTRNASQREELEKLKVEHALTISNYTEELNEIHVELDIAEGKVVELENVRSSLSVAESQLTLLKAEKSNLEKYVTNYISEISSLKQSVSELEKFREENVVLTSQLAGATTNTVESDNTGDGSELSRVKDELFQLKIDYACLESNTNAYKSRYESLLASIASDK